MSYPKIKYPDTEYSSVTIVIGSAWPEESAADKMEKWIDSQLLIYPNNQYHLTYVEILELFIFKLAYVKYADTNNETKRWVEVKIWKILKD